MPTRNPASGSGSVSPEARPRVPLARPPRRATRPAGSVASVSPRNRCSTVGGRDGRRGRAPALAGSSPTCCAWRWPARHARAERARTTVTGRKPLPPGGDAPGTAIPGPGLARLAALLGCPGAVGTALPGEDCPSGSVAPPGHSTPPGKLIVSTRFVISRRSTRPCARLGAGPTSCSTAELGPEGALPPVARGPPAWSCPGGPRTRAAAFARCVPGPRGVGDGYTATTCTPSRAALPHVREWLLRGHGLLVQLVAAVPQVPSWCRRWRRASVRRAGRRVRRHLRAPPWSSPAGPGASTPARGGAC